MRVECGHPACPLGAAAVVPLRLTDGPAGAVVAFATAGSPLDETAVETLEALGDQLSAQLQLSELRPRRRRRCRRRWSRTSSSTR